MKFADFTLRKKNILSNCVPLVMVAMMAVVSVYSIHSLLESNHWVDHTHRVIQKIMNIQGLAVDMETGLRGFELTGDETFLEPYRNAEKTIFEEIESLSETVSDNPEQFKRLEGIKEAIETWNNKVANGAIKLRIEIGDGKDMNDLADMIGEAQGKQYFDKIRDKIGAFIEIERELMVKRSKEAGGSFDAASGEFRASGGTSGLFGGDHSGVEYALLILNTAIDMETGMRGYLLSGKEAFLKPYERGKEKLYPRIDNLQKKVSGNSEQYRLLDDIRTLMKEWQENVTEPNIKLRRIIAGSKTMVDIKAFVAKGEGKKHFDLFRGKIAEFRAVEEGLMEERQKDARSTAGYTKIVIIGGLAAIIVITLVIAVLIANLITRPVAETVAFAEKLGNGDLSERLEIDQADEIGMLAVSLNRTTEDLSNLLVHIKENSENLASSSEEMSAVSTQLAGRAEETSVGFNATASAVEQMSVNAQGVSSTADQMSTIMNSIASAIEEMNSSIKDISENAGQGFEISQKAMEMSGSATKTISDLGEAASAIGEVTEVIKQIAQQTNLLALNATIEAASAGEAGKGFAVVANEIKALAGQSGTSAEDIAARVRQVQGSADKTIRSIAKVSGIIGEINSSSTVISRSVEQQTIATNEISASVQQANDGVGNIAASIAEIAKGANDISENTSAAASNVNDISAGARQIEISSGDLAKVAARLQEMAGRFRVEAEQKV